MSSSQQSQSPPYTSQDLGFVSRGLPTSGVPPPEASLAPFDNRALLGQVTARAAFLSESYQNNKSKAQRVYGAALQLQRAAFYLSSVTRLPYVQYLTSTPGPVGEGSDPLPGVVSALSETTNLLLKLSAAYQTLQAHHAGVRANLTALQASLFPLSQPQTVSDQTFNEMACIDIDEVAARIAEDLVQIQQSYSSFDTRSSK